MFVSSLKTDQTVEGLPLDILVDKYDINGKTLVKIDVQGHELSVLQGMSTILENKLVQFIIIEIHLKRGVSSKSVILFMKDYGYFLVDVDKYLFDQPHLYFASTPLSVFTKE
jgi:hypothetical protein